MWSKINNDLNPDDDKTEVISNKSTFGYLRIAATIIFMVGAATIAINYFTSDNLPQVADTSNDTIEAESNSVQMSDLSTDLAEVESFYSQKVNSKLNKLNDYEVDQELVDEVDNLKNEFDALKKEMGIGADQSIVVEAMIENYRLRLMLLEDLLEAVESTDNNKNTRHDRDI